eukprot:4113754-Ditylum_brightwellii.AAC.1
MAILPSSGEEEDKEGQTFRSSISIKTILNRESIFPSVVLSCPVPELYVQSHQEMQYKEQLQIVYALQIPTLLTYIK